jgi:NADPH:quinone reductase-like Zn-dependent oxidoreductase
MRIIRILAGLVALALGIAISRNAACEDAPVAAVPGPAMLAVVYRCYGTADNIRVETVPRPVPAADEVLVQVKAAAVNPLDWHYLRGTPYIMRLESGLGRPRVERLGVDFAGVVTATGEGVGDFAVGEAVFGGADGALGEFITVRADRAVARIPDGVSFEQAAALPIAAATALQALRDQAGLVAGQRVLVNGAAGGVGTYTVQLAKAYGATVTGVCSTRNVELVRSLGADQVVDYTREDFTRLDDRYDIIVDMIGNHSPLALRRVLAATGVVVFVGGGGVDDRWVGFLQRPLQGALLAPFVDQRFSLLFARLPATDLRELAALMAAGRLRSVIDRRYPLADAAAAIRYLETGRARGKVLVLPPG